MAAVVAAAARPRVADLSRSLTRIALQVSRSWSAWILVGTGRMCCWRTYVHPGYDTFFLHGHKGIRGGGVHAFPVRSSLQTSR